MKNVMSKKFYLFLRFVFFLSAIVVASAIIFLDGVEQTRFNGDEARHIASSYYYTDLLLKLNFNGDAWEGKHLGNFGSYQYVHFGQMLIGFPLQYYTSRSGERFDRCTYSSHISYKKNKRLGNIPPRGITLSARRSVVVFGVLSCLLGFLIGYYARNIWVGGLVAVLFMTNQTFIMCATSAMTDMHYLFFLLCFCLLVVLLTRFSRRKPLFLLCFLCGVIGGLAASVKLIGFGVVSFFFVLFIMYYYLLGIIRLKYLLFSLILFFGSVLIVIYLLDPYLWDIAHHPLRFPSLVKHHHVVNVIHEKLPYAMKGHRRLYLLHRALLSLSSPFSFGLIFLAAGILCSMVNFICSIRRRIFDYRVIPFLFFHANYLFILIFLTVNASRYYLQTVAACLFMIAYGIYEITRLFYRYCIEKRVWRRLFFWLLA